MIIIIDAYNVLKTALSTDFINDKQHKAFIAKVDKYTRLKNHEIIIVFDGGFSPWPMVTKKKKFSIVYAGTKSSADDYIKNYINRHKHKYQEIVLVSSDNDLYFYASQHDIATIDSQVFYKLLYEKVEEKKAQIPVTNKKTKGEARKYHSDTSNPELDALMESTNVTSYKEDYEEKNISQSSGTQLTKWEKKLLKIVKKL